VDDVEDSVESPQGKLDAEQTLANGHLIYGVERLNTLRQQGVREPMLPVVDPLKAEIVSPALAEDVGLA
jgi:hypothetical protein